MNGFDDRSIIGAAAKIAFYCLLDLGNGGLGRPQQQSISRHQHSGRAVATLKRPVLVEVLLQWMQLIALCKALERGDLSAFCLRCKHEAGIDSNAIHDDE